MKVILLQISDIHITGPSNRVFARKNKIAEAVRNLTYGLDLCVVVVTGDIAFSGLENEYAESLELFEALRKDLERDFDGKVPVQFIAIPGNHDCDFSTPNLAREGLVKLARTTGAVDNSIIDICTNIQNKFFEILDLYFNKELIFTNKLYWEYKFNIGAKDLLFRCYNTAWLSELKEKPSELFFPISYIPDQSEPSELVVSIFHHPYNWLTPDNGREFRKRVEEVSDLILTGHEHDITHRVSIVSKAQQTTYIEGGALQDSYNQSKSEFNCILIDTDLKQNAVVTFRWNGKIYSGESQNIAWDDYSPNRTRSKNEFSLSQTTASWLEDLGLQVRHPNRGLLTLSEIFVYPDLSDESYRKKNLKIIPGEEILGRIMDLGKVIISGSDDSGKTTLAKRYFKDFYENGLVPLYFNGGSGKTISAGERGVPFLLSEFTSQYEGITADEFRQLGRDKRVIIIDNFDKIKFKKGNRSVKEVVEMLTGFAQYVILFSNDLALHASEITSDSFAFITEGEEAFQQYRIQSFGHFRRELLIKKWFSFDEGISEGSGEFNRKVEEIKKLLDTIIGNNYIPPYPVVLLPLLQAQQFNENVNTNASTYGYFYELLIRQSLTEKSSQILPDVKNGYLTFLARHMYESKLHGLTERQWREFHSKYEDEYYISVNYSLLIEVLTDTHLLELKEGLYNFKYPYIYYYFTASSLRDRLSYDATKAEISRLAETLHEEESANILLFLTHLTKDRFIIDQMIDAAKKVFTLTPSDNLLSEINVFAGLNTFIETSFEDKDVNETRNNKNKRLDEIELRESQEKEVVKSSNIETLSSEVINDTEEDESNVAITKSQEEYMKNIGVAMKTLQILGQLLKNYVGTMDGPTKNALVNECKGIGFRTLASLLNSLDSNKEFFLKTMATIFMKETPELAHREAAQKAIESLFGVVHLNTYAIVRRISNAIGSPELKQVYDRMIESDDSPATQLVYTSVTFDHSTSFPISTLSSAYDKVKSNTLALEVLKSLTFNQFYLFNTPFPIKQKACTLLGVKYINSDSVNPLHKMIKK